MTYRVYQNGKEVFGKHEVTRLGEDHIGIFETMRAYKGKIFLEEEHLARLLDSAQTVGYQPLPDIAVLHGELTKALESSGEGNTLVRLTLVGGEIFVMLGLRMCPKELYQKGVKLKTASFPRGNPNAFPYQAKVSAYQQAILTSVGRHSEDIFDWIFLDRGNVLTETRVGNFFLVKYLFRDRISSQKEIRSLQKGQALLLTPPEHLILNGVTRRFVIKCAQAVGFKVLETPLTRHDFFNADEAFLTNTSWEILPVRALDCRAIGKKIPGPVTLKLHHFFKRRIQNDVALSHS